MFSSFPLPLGGGFLFIMTLNNAKPLRMFKTSFIFAFIKPIDMKKIIVNLIIYPMAFLCWAAHRIFAFDYSSFFMRFFDDAGCMSMISKLSAIIALIIALILLIITLLK